MIIFCKNLFAVMCIGSHITSSTREFYLHSISLKKFGVLKVERTKWRWYMQPNMNDYNISCLSFSHVSHTGAANHKLKLGLRRALLVSGWWQVKSLLIQANKICHEEFVTYSSLNQALSTRCFFSGPVSSFSTVVDAPFSTFPSPSVLQCESSKDHPGKSDSENKEFGATL